MYWSVNYTWHEEFNLFIYGYISLTGIYIIQQAELDVVAERKIRAKAVVAMAANYKGNKIV